MTLDSFTITAQNSDVATSTGDIGGTGITITPNIQYDIIQPVVGLIQPAGSIRDKEIIKFANATETVLVFSKTRHFRH